MANEYLNDYTFGLILRRFDIDQQTVAAQTRHIVIEQLAHD